MERVREWVEGFLRGRYGYGGRRAFGVPAVNPLGWRLRKPTVVVLAVAVVAMVLYVLLLYFGFFLPRLPPLIARPEEPLPAEDSIIAQLLLCPAAVVRIFGGRRSYLGKA